ncbi:BLUF domain-containing protein [Hymenobacter sp.]|uniref:BLUF domain-containing protein n=1 Tax=Hymenobacter sp. TaxID=1898978 RepID=UPI00286D5F2E|nr:BLUF domain-containing protein [Hymenobacter sp.]
MHHLVYTSTASDPLTEAELQRQLSRWRVNNARLGVTGVLLYSEGSILQVLEGAAEHLHALFATIAADVRHRSVTKLADGPVPGRVFAGWSMRFRSVSTTDFTRFVPQREAAIPSHASELVPLLEAFMAQEPLA